MHTTPKPVESAYALTALRVLPNGTPRKYSVTTWTSDPWRGCEWTIRTASKLGFLTEDGAEGYAVLDVLDVNEDIVQEFTIKNARAFQWFKRRLNWRVEDDD